MHPLLLLLTTGLTGCKVAQVDDTGSQVDQGTSSSTDTAPQYYGDIIDMPKSEIAQACRVNRLFCDELTNSGLAEQDIETCITNRGISADGYDYSLESIIPEGYTVQDFYDGNIPLTVMYKYGAQYYSRESITIFMGLFRFEDIFGGENDGDFYYQNPHISCFVERDSNQIRLTQIVEGVNYLQGVPRVRSDMHAGGNVLTNDYENDFVMTADNQWGPSDDFAELRFHEDQDGPDVMSNLYDALNAEANKFEDVVEPMHEMSWFKTSWFRFE